MDAFSIMLMFLFLPYGRFPFDKRGLRYIKGEQHNNYDNLGLWRNGTNMHFEYCLFNEFSINRNALDLSAQD